MWDVQAQFNYLNTKQYWENDYYNLGWLGVEVDFEKFRSLFIYTDVALPVLITYFQRSIKIGLLDNTLGASFKNTPIQFNLQKTFNKYYKLLNFFKKHPKLLKLYKKYIKWRYKV